jgi:acetyltransferase-like isoleucine patch superfamily enzyme
LRRPVALLTRNKARWDALRRHRRIERLRARGMHIGRDVHFPVSTYVDEEYCALISIGDTTSFGPECMILSHDDSVEAAAGAIRVGRVVLHASCHIGARAIILPGVEVGPRTIVSANSIVSRSLPADTVCAGRPARPFAALNHYLASHEERAGAAPTFPYEGYSIQFLTPERRAELITAATTGDAYVTGGRAAEIAGTGGSERTPLNGFQPTPPRTRRPRGDGAIS